jgi:hypothetical protein
VSEHRIEEDGTKTFVGLRTLFPSCMIKVQLERKALYSFMFLNYSFFFSVRLLSLLCKLAGGYEDDLCQLSGGAQITRRPSNMASNLANIRNQLIVGRSVVAALFLRYCDCKI